MDTDRFDVKNRWTEAIREGLSAAWLICLGYVAIGLAFGVVARNAGLRPLEIGLMSLIVYAGSSQFISLPGKGYILIAAFAAACAGMLYRKSAACPVPAGRKR